MLLRASCVDGVSECMSVIRHVARTLALSPSPSLPRQQSSVRVYSALRRGRLVGRGSTVTSWFTHQTSHPWYHLSRFVMSFEIFAAVSLFPFASFLLSLHPRPVSHSHTYAHTLTHTRIYSRLPSVLLASTLNPRTHSYCPSLTICCSSLHSCSLL